ncbi:MAG: 3-hydroxyacyl-CoA dehydrogenase [Frankiales bacterium]|nr:3-hydroxyacyl-CoA dehydrogenase [Frankiales bacterium]
MSEQYEEVVTSAKVRYVEVPGVAGEIALLTMDNGFDHTKPTTFGERGLANIDAALTEIEAHEPRVAAIAVTGKPFIFAVGADLKGIASIQDREQALATGREGHRVFKRLKDAAVPTFAFVNGAAMGGGLEIALHCDYRTISTGVPALALPECFLGLVPGWGGTQLLPNLIGPEKALQVIINNALSQNKMLKGPQALELGIADAGFEPADFLERSLDWAGQVLNGAVTVERPVIERGKAWQDVVAGARWFVDAKVKGSSPAPYKALDLVALAETASFEEGTAAEDEALADLIFSEELRAGLYAFDLVQRRAKRPAGAPDKALARKVTKVGVVGAGLMASQLALLFAQRLEVPVVMTDLDQGRLDGGVAYAHGEVDKLLQKGRVGKDKANRLKGLLTGSLTKDAFNDADFVIEAVFEEMGVKKTVLAELEQHVSAECVLATNTSSLSITEMASDLQHPERVVGFHFFNPVAVLPLLEIVRAEKTDDAALATAFATGKALKKSCILVKDAPAFVTNRLFMRFFGEVTKAIDEGTPFEVADKALDPLGLPMSPLQLLSFTGLPVSQHVAETLHEAFPDRFYVSPNLGRLVQNGVTSLFGADGTIDPDAQKLFETGSTVLTGEQVLQNALEAIADEADRIVREGVVAEPQDVDLALLLGGGWAFANGGITPYLDRTGISETVTGKRFLAQGLASLP